MLFCGIDLHSNNCVVIVSDEADNVLYSRRLVNDLVTICAALEPYRPELSGVVVESTYNWYWLVDGLIEAGHVLHLANTTAIKQYDGLKHRGDESDARHLAHLLRLGLLPEGHIMPKSSRAVRDLARKRMQLVDMRTANILSIETCMALQTGSYLTCREIKLLTEMDIDSMPIGPVEASGMKANLAILRALQAQIDLIEKSLSNYCRSAPGSAGISLNRYKETLPDLNFAVKEFADSEFAKKVPLAVTAYQDAERRYSYAALVWETHIALSPNLKYVPEAVQQLATFCPKQQLLLEKMPERALELCLSDIWAQAFGVVGGGRKNNRRG